MLVKSQSFDSIEQYTEAIKERNNKKPIVKVAKTEQRFKPKSGKLCQKSFYVKIVKL